MEPIPDQANKKADGKHPSELDEPWHHRPYFSADDSGDDKNEQ